MFEAARHLSSLHLRRRVELDDKHIIGLEERGLFRTMQQALQVT
jgi:hypothetical protein